MEQVRHAPAGPAGWPRRPATAWPALLPLYLSFASSVPSGARRPSPWCGDATLLQQCQAAAAGMAWGQPAQQPSRAAGDACSAAGERLQASGQRRGAAEAKALQQQQQQRGAALLAQHSDAGYGLLFGPRLAHNAGLQGGQSGADGGRPCMRAGRRQRGHVPHARPAPGARPPPSPKPKPKHPSNTEAGVAATLLQPPCQRTSVPRKFMSAMNSMSRPASATPRLPHRSLSLASRSWRGEEGQGERSSGLQVVAEGTKGTTGMAKERKKKQAGRWHGG